MISESKTPARLFLFDNCDTCRDPYHNIAVEEILMRHVPEDAVTLFLWQNERTVVIGRNQDARGECRTDLLAAEGGHLARRLSGGGAVYHNTGNLNFTFCAPEALYDVARQVAVIARAAASFGISVERTGRNDIMAEGRKFSGNAFYKSHGRCYHHGTILIAEDMANMVRYLDTSTSKLHTKSVKSVPARVVNLAELSPAVTTETFRRAMADAFCEVYGLSAERLSEADLPASELSAREAFFSSEEWLYGRTFDTDRTLAGRWDWGFLRLHLAVRGGVISDAAVDSDGLASELIAKIPEAAIGAAYEREALLACLGGLSAESGAEEEVLCDVRNLIKETL